MSPVDIALYIGSFFAIWFGTGIIVRAVNGFSKKLNVSEFAVSFFILGILTSIPEIAVGLTSITENKPGIYVGNLIGGVIILFFLVIPLLAILTNGIKLGPDMNKTNLVMTLGVCLLPILFSLDKKINSGEAIFSILVYAILFFVMQKGDGILNKSNHKLMKIKSYSLIDLFKTIAGVAIVFFSSQLIVQKTILISEILNISPFIISLIFLSIGTNLPEISLAIRSAFMKKSQEVVFGDYIGSASANTVILGILVLLSGGNIVIENNFKTTLAFILVGLGAFYYFARSHRDISRKEGIVLILVYLGFVVSQIMLH